MPSIMSNNWINVRPGDPALCISTNICDWFELGEPAGQDYWLEGEVVDDEFIFNGRLFLPGIAQAGTIIDNFPKGPTPTGWTKRPRVDEEGYELESGGNILFGYRVADIALPGGKTARICFVTVNIYSAGGDLVAESLGDEFRLHRSPASIGRGGIRFG
jgi:hypothetical protein